MGLPDPARPSRAEEACAGADASGSVETTDVRPGPHAIGGTLPGWRAVLMVMEHFWIWYRKSWRASVVSSVVQPVLFLLAFGIGFGQLVDSHGPGGAVLGGGPYLVYLAPGVLVMSAVQIAAFESTYPVLSGFKWQQTYLGMAASPLTPGQIAMGQLSWVGARILSAEVANVLVIVLVGGASGPGIVAALLVATLCGLAFAAATMAFAASLEQDNGRFSVFFRFVLVPMTLFAGTFFPVDILPVWSRPIAWITPLWHGNELARDLARGVLRPLPDLLHLGYLLLLLVVGIVLARRRFTRRLSR